MYYIPTLTDNMTTINGLIYSIRSHLTPNIYIGSTTQPLHKRFYDHKKLSNTTTSKSIIALGDAYIELVENYVCADKNELRRREGVIIRITPNCINHSIAGRTMTEYREDQKSEITASRKEYYESHKSEIAASKKKFRQTHKSKIAVSKKEYYESHKSEILASRKKYYESNPEIAAAKRQYCREYDQSHKEQRKEINRLRHISRLIAPLD